MMMPLIGESLDFRFYFLNTRTVMLLKDNVNNYINRMVI